MFIKEDIYTSSGSLKLYHCWTDKVTKFDSSSFYNWEQDNMPVYDLDERTFYLWEQLGYPTSSLPGVALVVSADATDANIGCNKNIFRTVSAAIEALPQTINFPVLIEIANFGNLGDLVLDNIKFGPRGSIEIINRNFAKADANLAINIGTLLNYSINFSISSTAPTNSYFYPLSIYTRDDINTNYGTYFNTRTHLYDSSCLSISSVVFSSISDSRLLNNLNGFVSIANWEADAGGTPVVSQNSKGALIVGSNNTTTPWYPFHTQSLEFTTYDLNPDAYDLISTYDTSTSDYLNSNQHLYLKPNEPTSRPSNGLFYGNKFNKLLINNCNGPIFIRNFFLDGSGASKTGNNYGVEVNNSKNIYLENIVSTRYRKAGLAFNNSNVTLLRSCVSTRNYEFDSDSKRLTGPWGAKKVYDTFNTSTKQPYFDSAAGMLANNSTITLSSTRSIEDVLLKNKILADSVAKYGVITPWAFPITDVSANTNSNYILDFSKNANGIILNNSNLIGGDKHNINNSDHYKYSMYISIYGNTECGIRSINSKISLDARLTIYENLFGIKLDSSVFEIDKLSVIYNQKIGLESNNSNIVYNKNLAPYVGGGTNLETNKPLHFVKNGQHLVLNNTKMYPMMTSGMDKIYDAATFDNSIGVKNPLVSPQTKEIIPAIEIKNSSELILVSPYLTRDTNHAVDTSRDTGAKGSEISVTNNSKAVLQGAKYNATRIIGPSGRTSHKNLAGAYAGNNSTIELNGPTVIAKYGVDLLAEKKSSININPHGYKDEGSLDISSFSLIDKENHTAVELHSTRACVVVDDHSTFNARDLGSFKKTWDTTGSFYTNRGISGIDYTSIDYITPYVSAGSLQFYPNPIPPINYGVGFPGQDSPTIAGTKFTANTNPGLYYLKNEDTTTNFDFSTVTNGGFCVRALNNSLVNVHNVNFPTGWWNCSGAYYDNTQDAAGGGLCYKTFIWNIADNSELKASYLSISGVYPTAAGYVGPRGTWTSGASIPASGLPNSTPDTSSLSVLDYFGYVSSTNVNPYGKTTAENYGPFRLYFSVDPAAHALSFIASGPNDSSIIPQLYSQGYLPSGSMRCSPAVSSMYLSLLQRNSSNSIQPSGYYYGSGMVDTGAHVRVMLDESAANVFANAKHCSVGKSGNVKLVSIYYPYENVNFGDSYNILGIKSINNFDLQRDN